MLGFFDGLEFRIAGAQAIQCMECILGSGD